MPQIEGFRIRNFKTLRDITLGKLWNAPEFKPLTPLTVVIGKNGVGKSTIFDAFGFLGDCLKVGVEEACDLHNRGGFERICSQGKTGPIQFEICYRVNNNSPSLTYEIAISLDKTGRPYIHSEQLFQIDIENDHAIIFLMLILGKGGALKTDNNTSLNMEDEKPSFNLSTSDHSNIENPTIKKTNTYIHLSSDAILKEFKEALKEIPHIEPVELLDLRKLGIATLGSLKQHPTISRFREFIEGWYLSYFSPDAARSLPIAGAQKHLNIRGDNIGNVVQFMAREHKNRFQAILDNIAKKIPGIHKISTAKTIDGRLAIQFNERGFQDPFFAQQMSDGTLKVFAYLLLLNDPNPPPFICIEEPENGLYHKLLETLAAEFREHATGKEGGSQIFITTHQPYFVDALNPDEVWILEKGEDGFAKISRASDDPLVRNMVAEGLPLGGLWYSDYLDAR